MVSPSMETSACDVRSADRGRVPVGQPGMRQGPRMRSASKWGSMAPSFPHLPQGVGSYPQVRSRHEHQFPMTAPNRGCPFERNCCAHACLPRHRRPLRSLVLLSGPRMDRSRWAVLGHLRRGPVEPLQHHLALRPVDHEPGAVAQQKKCRGDSRLVPRTTTHSQTRSHHPLGSTSGSRPASTRHRPTPQPWGARQA